MGDGVLTFTELKKFFKGDEELCNYFITNIDLCVSAPDEDCVQDLL